MSDHKHTPSPWRVEEGTTLVWHGETSTSGYPVAEAFIGRNSIARSMPYPTEGEAEANARLIAAAPALRDALNELVKLLGPLEEAGALDGTGLATLNRYRKALALADGQEETS